MSSSNRPPQHARASTEGWASERGSHTIEMVILPPVVMLLVFLAVQASLWFYARAIASGAAQEGARVAATYGGTLSGGLAAASASITEVGWDDAVGDAVVTGTVDGDWVEVRVRGHALSLVPGFSPSVEQSARIPIEKLTEAVP